MHNKILGLNPYASRHQVEKVEKNILTINRDDWDSEYHDLYIHKTGNNVNEKKKTCVFSVKELRSYIYSKECRGWKRKSCSPEGLGWTWNMLWWGWWRGKICLWVCFYQQYWSENNAAPVPDLWRHWLSWKLGGDTWQTNSTIQADRRRTHCRWLSHNFYWRDMLSYQNDWHIKLWLAAMEIFRDLEISRVLNF